MAGVKINQTSFADKARTLRSALNKLEGVIEELPPGAETTRDVDLALNSLTSAWEELWGVVRHDKH